MSVPSESEVKSFLAENPSFVKDWILNEADQQTVENIAQAIKVLIKKFTSAFDYIQKLLSSFIPQ